MPTPDLTDDLLECLNDLRTVHARLSSGEPMSPALNQALADVLARLDPVAGRESRVTPPYESCNWCRSPLPGCPYGVQPHAVCPIHPTVGDRIAVIERDRAAITAIGARAPAWQQRLRDDLVPLIESVAWWVRQAQLHRPADRPAG